MESCTRYLDGKKFETLLDGYRIVTDQPTSECGTGAGLTPPELLLASLASCAGHYTAEYVPTRSLPLTGLHVHASANKGTQPPRLAFFRVEVDVPGLEARHCQGILRAVRACLIHNTLMAAPTIEVEVSAATQDVSLRGCTAVAASLNRIPS